MITTISRIFVLCTTFILINIQSQARTEVQEKQEIELDEVEVVFSSNKTETEKLMAPCIVQKLDARKLEQTHASMVAEALPFQSGVRVEDNCQNCGYKQARINGLDGHYTQLLINSRPVFSAISNLYGLEQIPTSMVSNIEVIRGGGSALYGGSAVAGTINIITKEPERNGADLAHNLTVLNDGSLDNTTSANATVLSSDQNAGLAIFMQNRNRQGYSYYKDGYTNIPMLKTLTFGTNLLFRPSGNSRMAIGYRFLRDDRRGGNKMDSVPEKANIAETAQHDIHNASVDFGWTSSDQRHRFELYSALATVNRDSYTGGYGSEEDPDPNAGRYYTRTKDVTWLCGGLFRTFFEKCWFMRARLTVGGEYTNDRLKDEMLGYGQTDRQKTDVGSLFAQNEWNDKKWTLLLGLRMDKYSSIGHPIISPRINVRYSPVHSLSLRATYSDGFRAPQIFDEDLHIEVASGNRFKIKNADDLKEERSHSYTISAEYMEKIQNAKVKWMAELFLTDLNNIFAERETDRFDDAGNTIIERHNSSGAMVKGITAETEINLSKKLDIEIGFTFQNSEYDVPETWSDDAPSEKKMFRTPDTYGFAMIEYTPIVPLTISFNNTYTGKMLMQHFESGDNEKDKSVETSDFWDCGLSCKYSIPIHCVKMNVGIGVRNIFNAFQKDLDKGSERDGAYIYGPASPRNYYFEISFHL